MSRIESVDLRPLESGGVLFWVAHLDCGHDRIEPAGSPKPKPGARRKCSACAQREGRC